MKILIWLSIRLHALSLRLYPPSFRAAFGEEMQEVYQGALLEAAPRGLLPLLWVCLREALDLPANLVQEHWSALRAAQGGIGAEGADGEPDRPAPWPAVLAGASLFLVAGLGLIVGEIPVDWPLSAWLFPVRAVLFLSLLFLSALGFGIGWIKGFPRWSYPYVMSMIMVSLYLIHVAPSGLPSPSDPLQAEQWGWLAWIPGLAMAAIALLVSRSLRPAVQLFANVWEDWTLLTWGMYGTMPLLITVGFAEVDRLYALPFVLFLTAVMASTAIAYLRSRQTWQQSAVLLVGTLLTVGVVAVAPALYWLESGWDDLPGLVLGTVVVVLAMFAPAFIGLLHRSLRLLRWA